MERVRKLLEEAKWIFAKTMPDNPHHYCLRKTFEQDADFVYLVEYIRNNGIRELWGGHYYVNLYLNDYKYWTMGAPINNNDGTPCTILINRASCMENLNSINNNIA